MVSMYSDTFTGSGALGNIEVGPAAWQAITGTWTRSGGIAATTTAASSNPIAVIDVGVADVDMSVAVGSNGGSALYFRVYNATNWWRLAVDYYTTTQQVPHQTTSTTPGYWTPGPWQLQVDSCVNGYDGPNDSYSGTTQYTKQPAIWVHTAARGTCQNGGTGQAEGWEAYQSYSRSDVWVPEQTTTTTTYTTETSYYYYVYLEKCVNGTITRVGSYAGAPSSLRITANGASIQAYVNGTQRIATTDTFGQAETKHGIGLANYGAKTSTLDNFTLDPFIPPAPTIVAPANNSIVTTGIPGLIGTVNQWGNINCKIRYQIAQDASFTTGLVTYDEPDTAYRLNGNYTLTLLESQYLTQRGWYIRARQIGQLNGLMGNWATPNSFTVAHAPGAINLQPANGNGVVYGAINRLSWQFNDTSSIDSQTAYQVIVERNDTGALVIDTGKVTSASQYYDLAVDAAYKNIQLRWKVMVWDEEDKASSFTNYALFIPTDAPVVTILKPANNSNVGTSRPTVDWTFAASGGRTQASYRVTVNQQGSTSLLSDSGTVASLANEYVVNNPVIKNGNSYVITLYVTDSVGITVSQSVVVNGVYEEPDIVNFSVDSTEYETSGYVRLTWQQTSDSTFKMWRVYRRKYGDAAYTKIGEIPQLTVTEFDDYMVPSMEDYEYYVIQVVERFGEDVESVVGAPQVISLGTGGYWLIDPVNYTNNTRIHIVTDENYTKAHEQAEYTVIGRGRHVDEGEKVGKSGTMTAKLRSTDGTSARYKKQTIESLRDRGIPVYLRSPFGDIDYIALGDIGVTRIAGTGSDEFVDVTIPYLQVF